MTKSAFQLHVITDGVKQSAELKSIVRQAVQGGADVIQLRYKSAPALDLFRLGEEIHPLILAEGGRLLINDRADVALALQAGGVHLAAKSLPISAARPLFPAAKWIGCSVHSVEEALAAQAQGATYITYGHIFATGSKPGLAPRGLAALQSVVDAVEIPVLAIGGITTDNIDDVLATGAAGIAVISAVMADGDPMRAAQALREKMDASLHRPRHALPGCE
ncbi:thiamine-phosphate diphosphorylase [Tumebacillus sp. BK434]|uniref:thiamine phosphate synthase n=1 Tax=Tumebacillus sp. BK434 TaxID=2512169 RepID=UPI00104F1DB6|nr:thiamine phosphate synthase [Tumebacillus sp. BK434]TCP55359.1 thiamine-phosphate diphosphorylase [Tumebacillus sp. BK434]